PVRPLERVSELERAPVLVEGRTRLAAPLEHGAEIRVHGREARRPHLDLLELVGRLVQHLELEEDAAERQGERGLVGRTLQGLLVERDHPPGPPLLAKATLEPYQERKRRLRLRGALPDSHRRPADVVGAGEQRRSLGVVRAARGRPAPVEEALEVEADREERAERGEERHGEDGCARGWRRGAAPRTPSPWPCAPLARSPADSR